MSGFTLNPLFIFMALITAVITPLSGIEMSHYVSKYRILHKDKTYKPPKLDHSPFIVFSPPKCGTHLIGKTLGLITEETPAYYLTEIPSGVEAAKLALQEVNAGRFMIGHNFDAPFLKLWVDLGYKIVFLIRDPRDQLVSVRNWFREKQWSWIPGSKIADPVAQLESLITGDAGWKCFESCFLKYEDRLAGIAPEKIYYVYFENLVGPLGGGSQDAQYNEILGLAQFLEIPLDITQIESIAEKLYGKSPTFRHGQIGSWKENFTERHKELFKQYYNSHLIRLGYEINNEW